MKQKALFILFSALACINTVISQDLNNIKYHEMQLVSARHEIVIPDIPGFKTLKCDFHMHTVFSDGIVWPTFRVEEAWEDGLDAIAITDHIEYQPLKKYLSGDHNSSYEIALPEAVKKNLILIRAGEITRQMPPGHLNALFLADANLLNVPDVNDALAAAKKQGAFIIWNHPGWKAQQPDTCLWMPMHQKLFEGGFINGIEVFNETEYYPVVLDWCINKKIGVIGCTDIHGIVSESYDLKRQKRPVTLVFAKERSEAAIKEALFQGRTLAFFNNKLAGRKDLLNAVFSASVSFKPALNSKTGKNISIEITNASAISYEIETAKGDLLIIPAESTIVQALNPDDYKNCRIRNLLTGSTSSVILNSLY
jgi:3',5'-nucleoside bisphosphate phosphatase